MIARPKISRNERKTTEIGAFEVGNFAPFSCPGAKRWNSFMWSMFVLNRLVDGYFLADMIINFNTAVFDAKSGCWITDRRVIAERYMENWFAIDVISILPYDVLSVSKSFNRFRLLRTLKVLKLLKLLRVVRIGRLLNWWASGQHKRATFPTSKAPSSAVFDSLRLIFGRAIISRDGLEA